MMTREKMKAIQSVPKRPERMLVRTYRMMDTVVPYREDVYALALAQGRVVARSGGDVTAGWWPALAPLTHAEQQDLRAALIATKAV